ncbi:MAG TPA: SCO family protein [Solimonas sp.]
MTNVTAKSSPSKTIAFAFAGALALIGGILAATWFNTPATTRVASGTLLQQPRVLPPLSLIDENGQPFDVDQLKNRWTLIFPGFTYCPDICPTTLALLKNVQGQLGPKAEKLQVALFSVDPERDTPERLKEYVHYFSPSFRGVTTPEPNLKAVAQALGVAYAKVPGATPETYTMDHSAALILINPRGELAGYFTGPLQAPALVADLQQLL